MTVLSSSKHGIMTSVILGREVCVVVTATVIGQQSCLSSSGVLYSISQGYTAT